MSLRRVSAASPVCARPSTRVPNRHATLAVAFAVATAILALVSSPALAAAQETQHRIAGSLTNADGEPLGGQTVRIQGIWNSEGENRQAFADADGTFDFGVPDGTYWLLVLTTAGSDCTVAGSDDPSSVHHDVITVSGGAIAGLELAVSGAPATAPAWLVCAEPPGTQHRVEGTLRGSDGEPIGGVSVYAFGEAGQASFGPWTASTDSTGAYAVDVPEGSYVLEFQIPLAGGACRLGYTGSGGGYTRIFYDLERFEIPGEDATGFETQLPATEAELCRPIRGQVTDAQGNPLSVSVAVDSIEQPRGSRWNGASDADGNFTLYGPALSYFVLVATTAGSECTIAGPPNEEPGLWSRIAVGDDGASGIQVIVSGEPSPVRQNFYCSNPPGMITTELQPGWNLAGWTSRKAGVEAIFEAIPELDVVHAWDAEEQRFKSAFDPGSDLIGDLEALTPGMGLWLHVRGAGPVAWTRAFLPASGFASLTEGWNLVAWAGANGASVEDALASLGGGLTEAAAWDPLLDQFLRYAAANPATHNTLQRVNRGEALWLRVAEARHWLQPGSAQPPIRYAEGTSAAAQESFPAAVEAVLVHFADRYGVFVPTVSFEVDEGLRRFCGFYQSRTVYLRETCLRAVAHEYVHAIQAQVNMAGGRNPAWITEGMANRWSSLYYDSTGDRIYEDHIRDITLPNARLTPVSLEEMEETLTIEPFTGPNYSVAHLAVDWVVALTGEDRILKYYTNRASYETWQEAFAATFGIGVGAFYESFERHRAEIAPFKVVRAIEGTIVGPDGQPLVGLSVRAFGNLFDNNGTFGPWTDPSTDAGGAFRIHVPPDGSYLLEVFRNFDGTTCTIGYYGADGESSAFDRVARIAITDVDVTGIALSVSVPGSELCHRIEGTVITVDGTPLGNTQVAAFEYGSTTTRPTGASGPEGTFTLHGQDGTYHLGIRAIEGSRCTVSGYANGTHGEDAILTVDGGDVSGLHVVVSVGSGSSSQLLWCTFAE